MSIKWEKRLPNHCCIFLEVTRLILTLFRCSSMAEFNQYSWWARWRGFRISRLHHDTDQQGTFSYIICSFCWWGGRLTLLLLLSPRMCYYSIKGSDFYWAVPVIRSHLDPEITHDICILFKKPLICVNIVSGISLPTERDILHSDREGLSREETMSRLQNFQWDHSHSGIRYTWKCPQVLKM